MQTGFLILISFAITIPIVIILWINSISKRDRVTGKKNILNFSNKQSISINEILSKLKHGDFVCVHVKGENQTRDCRVVSNIPSQKKIELVRSGYWDNNTYHFYKHLYDYNQISDGFEDMNKNMVQRLNQHISSGSTLRKNTQNRYQAVNNPSQGPAGYRAPKID